MCIHVCTMFRHVCTVLPNPVQVVRIPDAGFIFADFALAYCNMQNMQNISKSSSYYWLIPTAHNDSDSDIASLASWLRLGSHGTYWQPGRTGPGGLNLKPRFAKPRIMAGAGVLPAQRRRRTGRLTSARRRCAISNLNLVDISYDTPVSINAGGVVVRAALQYA